MPIYCYYCPECKKKFERVLPMSESQNEQRCDSGHISIRDLRAEHSSGNLSGLMEEHPRYSISLGVTDEQLETAKKLHPQVSDWKKFGNSWRPLIRNRIEKLKIMQQANFYEYEPGDRKV